MIRSLIPIAFLTVAVHAWQPAADSMLTDWGAKITPEQAWREYPRPALAREQWSNLNGLWKYAVTPKTADTAPAEWSGDILVPFAIDSALSGVKKRITPEDALWYRREISAAKSSGKRTLLNFEAVDYQSTVWINDTKVRETTVMKDANGHLRLALNGKEIFHWGTLDQGWWPDGLLTPPSDEAMASDIKFLKEAGFNTIRKHIKVEPRRYYTHCDRIGMLVWQDQVSSGTGESDVSPKWTRLQPNPVDAA